MYSLSIIEVFCRCSHISWEFPPGHGTCMVLASVANDTKKRWEHASNAWKNGKISRYFADMVSTHLS